MIILGLTNPYDGEALAPNPVGCSGWRLWKMTGLRVEDYLALDRRNLFHKSTQWDAFAAGRAFQASLQPGETVIALGDEVRMALRLPRQLILPMTIAGVTYRQIPHPSGRNLFYNDPVNLTLVETMLRCLTSGQSLKSAEELMATFDSAPPSLSPSRS